MIENGKLGFMHCPLGRASIFAIGKKDSSKLREVWAGQHISAMSLRPPRPPLLGNPGVFARIIKSPSRALYFSKRDATAFFDQLALPSALVPCFGRPRISVSAMVADTSMSLEDVAAHVIDKTMSPLRPSDKLTPVSLVWPMGFSWSSFVAQSTLLDVALAAGIAKSQILALDQPHPMSQDELVALATDDAIFIHSDLDTATATLRHFDRSLTDHKIERNQSKDEDAEDHIVALGCALGNHPPWVEPDCRKLFALLLSFLGITDHTMIRPRSVEGMLGVAQWFAQVPRWSFAIFDKIYSVQVSGMPDVPCCLSSDSLSELHAYALLAPLLVANLERPLLPILACCDASPSFGFGVSVRACEPEVIQQLASKSERHGDYLTFTDPDTSNKEQKRAGTPIVLPYIQHGFIYRCAFIEGQGGQPLRGDGGAWASLARSVGAEIHKAVQFSARGGH